MAGKFRKQNKTQKKTVIVIGVGGYLQAQGPIVEKECFSTEDEEYDAEEFENFDDYVDYCLEEKVNELEQHFARTIVLDEKEAAEVASLLSSLII